MVVLPKRKALAQANQDLAAARAKLAELKAKLQVSFSVNTSLLIHTTDHCLHLLFKKAFRRTHTVTVTQTDLQDLIT